MAPAHVFLHHSRRVLIWLTIAGLALLVLVWAAAQWVVLHDVGRWRPWVEQMVSQTVGSRVTVARLLPGKFHLFPTVVLENVTVYDPQGQPGLNVGRIQARVDPWDFLRGKMDFDRLIIEAPSLTLVRDREGHLSLSGIRLPAPGEGSSPFFDWLLNQGEIRITQGTLVWRDGLRAAPDLLLRHVDLDIRNGASIHSLEVALTPPETLSTPLQLRLKMRGAVWGHWRDWQGQGEADAAQVNWVALSSWLDGLQGAKHADGRLHVMADLSPAEGLKIESDLDVHALVWQLPSAEQPLSVNRLKGKLVLSWHGDDMTLMLRHVVLLDKRFPHFDRPLDLQLHAGSTSMRVKAAWLDLDLLKPFERMLPLTPEQRHLWQALGLTGQIEDGELAWLQQGSVGDSLSFSGQLHHVSVNAWHDLPSVRSFSGNVKFGPQEGEAKGAGLTTRWDLPQVLVEPLVLQSFQVDLRWHRGAAETALEVRRLQLVNGDFKGHLDGTLTLGAGGPGKAHLQGKLTEAKPEAVWRYMPRTVSEPARAWLQHALQGGRVSAADFSLDGDLARFPFAQDQGGVFRVDALLAGVRLRYAPSWPAVDQIGGKLAIRGSELTVEAEAGSILGANLDQVHAHIPDVTRRDAVVSVTGQLHGPVMSALDFMAQSPVDRYTNHALLGWKGSGEGRLTLALQVPLANVEQTQVQGDYEWLAGASLDGQPLGIPPLEALQGHVHFTEKSVFSDGVQGQVLGGASRFELKTDDQGGVHLKAEGRGDWSRLRRIYRDALLKDVTGIQPWSGQFDFVRGRSDVRLWATGLYLGEPFSLEMQGLPEQGLGLRVVGATSAHALRQRFGKKLLGPLSGAVGWVGSGVIRHDRLQAKLEGEGVWWGEAVTFSSSRDETGRFKSSFAGHASMTALKAWWPMLNRFPGVSGATDWSARVSGRDEQVQEWWVSTSLAGVTLAWPDPMGKPADQAMLLALHGTVEGPEWRAEGQLGDRLGGRAVWVQVPAGQVEEGVRLDRATLWLGQENGRREAGPGFALFGHWPDVDVDGWLRTLASATGPQDTAGPGLDRFDVTLDRVRWQHRAWHALRLDGTVTGRQWNVRAHGPDAEGNLVWLGDGDRGRLMAHMSHWVWPDGPPKAAEKNQEPSQSHAADMPTLDVTVDEFDLAPSYKGRLRLKGYPDGVEGWRLQQLELDSSTTQWHFEGAWNDRPSPHNRYQWHVKSSDFGKFLSDFGYPGLLARTSGEGNGALEWEGGLSEFDVVKLGGEAHLLLHDGQFPHIQPGGVGRLISLFSLQTLPRRITLDFHDVFSEGFAFDYLGADLALAHDRLTTRDFDMRGPAAKVKIKGEVDLGQETTDLTARVEPALGDSVALASAVVGGPVVGAASWVVQKILGNPFDKALAYEYVIHGPWDEPDIQAVHRP